MGRKRQEESTAMGRLHTLASAQANARVGVVCSSGLIDPKVTVNTEKSA